MSASRAWRCEADRHTRSRRIALMPTLDVLSRIGAINQTLSRFALFHDVSRRRVWQAVAAGPHEWVVIMEDDITVVSKELLTQLPAIPELCDFLFLVPRSVVSEPVCATSEVNWALFGYGTWGYLINRRRAQALVDASQHGFNGPVDFHLYRMHCGCVTKTARVNHSNTGANDTTSIRQFLNGQVDINNDQPHL